MAIGTIGFFGRGDLMRQKMYYDSVRYRGMPLSQFAQGTVVDVGVMPGSVMESPNMDQPAALPAVSGYGSFDGWGKVTPFQALTYPGMIASGPAGWAAIAANQKSLAHAKKMRDGFLRTYKKLKARNARDKRLTKVKAKYDYWNRVYAHHLAVKKAHAHLKATKKAIRKGTLTKAQRARLLASHRVIARTRMRPRMGLMTGAQAASSAGLATSSSQGAMVPPGSYDYVAPAQALATTADSVATAPTQLVAADVDLNDDGVRDDIAAGGDGSGAAAADDGTMATDSGEGIMARMSDFFGSIPKWALILGVLGIGGLAFSRTTNGRRFLQRISRKFKGSKSAPAAA